jgi:hypothetical protein
MTERERHAPPGDAGDGGGKRQRVDGPDSGPAALPAPLVAYAYRLLSQEACRAGVDTSGCDVQLLVTQLEALSRDTATGSRADSFRTAARRVASTFRGHREVFPGAGLTWSSSASELLSAWEAHRAACDAARRCIGTHHHHLRVSCATAAESERVDAWEVAVTDKEALRAYAAAAKHTGSRAFVRDAHDWCVRTATAFFHGGTGAQAAVKEARRLHYAEHGTKLAADGEAQVRQKAQAAMTQALAGNRVRLLDIGSCHDPWRPLHDFDVVALDLQPASSSVFTCDFLALEVGPSLVCQPSCGAHDGAGRLLSLPAASFHVAVLSLVLSYIPDALARTRAVAKARELLHDTAGLLLIVTPISTNAGFTPQRQLPVLQEWQEAIQGLGFARHAYERLNTVHVMAYRTVPLASHGEVVLRPMRIAFDHRSARAHTQDCDVAA